MRAMKKRNTPSYSAQLFDRVAATFE